MGTFTDAGRAQHLNTAFRALAIPTAYYVALFVGDPLGAGVEVAGTGYARQPIATAGGFGAPTGVGTVTIANVAPLTYGPFGVGVVALATHWALYAVVSGGSVLASGQLLTVTSAVPRTVAIAEGDSASLPAGAVTVSLT